MVYKKGPVKFIFLLQEEEIEKTFYFRIGNRRTSG